MQRSGRDAGETGVGDHGHLFAPFQIAQRRGDLVNLLHPRAQRTAADEDDHVARLNLPLRFAP